MNLDDHIRSTNIRSQNREWIGFRSIKSRQYALTLEKEAWKGAKFFLYRSADTRVIKEFADYPMLPAIIERELLDPLINEDEKALMALMSWRQKFVAWTRKVCP